MPLYVISPQENEDAPAPGYPNAQIMGHAAGLLWLKSESAPAEAREPTADELAVAMLELPGIRQLKASVQRRIEQEVGDVHEILADQAKQIEALTALVARMAADYLGGTEMDAQTKTTYLQRVEAIVAALDSGQLTLRGDDEGPDEMIQKVMARSSRINQIVAEEYLPRRDALTG